MTASAKGPVDAPGQNVRPKAGLNRVILATGWSGLHAMLEYQAPRLVAVDPRHTSQGRLAAEAGVATHEDPGVRPAPADLGDDPLQFRHRSRRDIDIGRPPPGAQHVVPASDGSGTRRVVS